MRMVRSNSGYTHPFGGFSVYSSVVGICVFGRVVGECIEDLDSGAKYKLSTIHIDTKPKFFTLIQEDTENFKIVKEFPLSERDWDEVIGERTLSLL